MNILKSNLFKSSIVYTLINFVNKIFPFLLLPFFTRLFSLEEYGMFSLFRSSSSILIPLVGLSMSEAVIRKFYELKKIELGEYIWSILVLNIFVFILLFCIVIFLGDSIIQLSGLSKLLLLLCLSISFFTAINNIERGLFRCENKNKLFTYVVIGQTLIYFFTVLVFSYFFKLTLYKVAFIELGVFAIFGFHSIYYLIKNFNINFKYNERYLNDAIKYSFPLVINSLLAYAFALSDRFIINYELGADSVAKYAAAFQIASVIQILAVSFNSAWLPWVFNSLSNKVSSKKIISIQLIIMVLYIIVGALFWIICYNYLTLILGSKYADAREFLLWFIGSNLMQGFYWLFSPIIQFNKKNWQLLFASIPALILSISLNLMFLKNQGVIFAAQVNFISWFLMFVVTLFCSLILMKKFNHDKAPTL